MPIRLNELHDDVAIYLFDLLDVLHILLLRQTCRRIKQISELRIVWTNACNHQILPRRFPFPDIALEELTVPQLERHTRHASRLASRWLSLGGSPTTPISVGSFEFDATNGTRVFDLRFVPSHEGRWLLTISKGIWSIITLWELPDAGTMRNRKLFEWSRRDCLLQSFVLNGDSACEGALAVSVTQAGHSHVELMSIHKDAGFRIIRSIASNLSPVYLRGDLIVLCDPIDLTLVLNWRTGATAILQRPPALLESVISVHDRCTQILFEADCVLVVRARSLTLFPNPPLERPATVHAPLISHSFGWVDGVAVTTILSSNSTSNTGVTRPLSILIRPEPDDPWAGDDEHDLDLYTLPPAVAPDEMEYRIYFRQPSRPGCQAHAALSNAAIYGSAHAALRCGSSRRIAARNSETGVDTDGPTTVLGCTLRSNELNNWKALEYDEVRGRIAVGSTRGKVTVLSLA
ncbi:hypothetical protein B0H10DRAFT_2193343 [Mycena sp. CBHHK59/15]|nr:hypothetical protein B0H10DRAFT_2193343 [Mycena sp. CBHHK59/15]